MMRTMMTLLVSTMITLASVVVVHAQEFGNSQYGCYSMTDHQCNCSPEVCTKESCEAEVPGMHIFTEGCTSCSCANSAEIAAAVAEAAAEPTDQYDEGQQENNGIEKQQDQNDESYSNSFSSGESDSNENSGVGFSSFGCYRLADHVCLCTPEVCSEQTCTGQGEEGQYFWTDGCKSCKCGTVGNGAVVEDRQEGFGCFDATVHNCDCSPSVCGKSTCESISKFHSWTDKCSSCQCSSEDIKNNEEQQQQEQEDAGDETNEGGSIAAENKNFSLAMVNTPVVEGFCTLVSFVGIVILFFTTRTMVRYFRGTRNVSNVEKGSNGKGCYCPQGFDDENDVGDTDSDSDTTEASHSGLLS